MTSGKSAPRYFLIRFIGGVLLFFVGRSAVIVTVTMCDCNAGLHNQDTKQGAEKKRRYIHVHTYTNENNATTKTSFCCGKIDFYVRRQRREELWLMLLVRLKKVPVLK